MLPSPEDRKRGAGLREMKMEEKEEEIESIEDKASGRGQIL